ncbi:MAG: hypothetical protein EHM35_03780 [Planctomycetaceae bacterium]|nr:MAG: hypothetical protein EHM35_03780 [Planctomycetaceae bacterium]
MPTTTGLPKIDFDKTYRHPPSPCCECGKKLDSCNGPGDPPQAGDFMLCLCCASLNVFADDGVWLRRPTDEEMLRAAADPTIQLMRRVALKVAADMKDKRDVGSI